MAWDFFKMERRDLDALDGRFGAHVMGIPWLRLVASMQKLFASFLSFCCHGHIIHLIIL